MKKKRTTIKDIARIAAVSPTAVSMALNDHPRIGKNTRKKIHRIAKKLNYQPNFMARTLVGKRSHTIGLVITNVTDSFYPELAQGIEDKADELGYRIILCSTKNSLEKEKYCIEVLRNRVVDGLIISSTEISGQNIRALVDEKFPFVLVNRRIMNQDMGGAVDYVVADNALGAYMMMEHLYKLGHKRIGIITGLLNASTALERTEAIKKFLKDHGIKLEPSLFANGGYSRELACNAAKKLLRLKPPPTAIFAESDEMALAARDVILESGLKIPEDIALVGFDNIGSTSCKGVEITTVGQKKYEMGSLAVEILVNRIENSTFGMVNTVVLKPEIIIRRSCGYFLDGYVSERLSRNRKSA